MSELPKLFGLLTTLLMGIFFVCGSHYVEAAGVGTGKRLIFIPLDNRPITCRETYLAAEKLGYRMLVPPEEILGSDTGLGDPEKLWSWLRENAVGTEAAVLSTDSLLYGSLVGSRGHTLQSEEIADRIARFGKLKQDFPRLKIYAYGTVLRTLLSSTHSGVGMEPEDYQKNAVKIYRYSALRDKIDQDMGKGKDKKEFNRLQGEISAPVLGDWERRHRLNFAANQSLIDLTATNVLNYFLLGGDDSAVLSQTHYECRKLREYGRGKDLGDSRFQVMSGADELGMVMLSRAVCDDQRDIPFVYAAYNEGLGADTIPRYCFDKIGVDVRGAVIAAGGMMVNSPETAELVLAINTNPNGKTDEANSKSNTVKPRTGSRYFLSLVKDLTAKGYPVAVGDIAYSNGADNALMAGLVQENLQFRLRGYGGWNTATNTTGFLIGTGLMAKWMDENASQELMLRRYLDDWAYQANVRQKLAAELPSLESNGPYDPNDYRLQGKREAAAAEGAKLLREFAEANIKLPSGLSLKGLTLTHPWNRLFEAAIYF